MCVTLAVLCPWVVLHAVRPRQRNVLPVLGAACQLVVGPGDSLAASFVWDRGAIRVDSTRAANAASEKLQSCWEGEWV